MDNLTHSLVGLATAKAGLGRVSPYATAVSLMSANLPDADVVALAGGQWIYLKHHRGFSHSLLGTLILALALPLVVWSLDMLVARLRRRPPRARLGRLVLVSLIVSATHPLLDWTNSYGVRPFLPWDARWFYGDLVFIIDPWLWLILGGACFLLTATKRWRVAAWAALALILTAAVLFLPSQRGMPYPLAGRVLWVGAVAGLFVAYRARLAARWGTSIALAAFALVVVYWGALALLHTRALAQAETLAETWAARDGESVARVAAMPTLADPTRWLSVVETDRAYLRFNLSLNEEPRDLQRFDKPRGEDARLLALAAQDERALIFLDFARFPVSRTTRNCASDTLVQLADLRFAAPGDRRRSFTLEIPVSGVTNNGQ